MANSSVLPDQQLYMSVGKAAYGGCHRSIEAALDTLGRLILSIVNSENLDSCVRYH